MQVQRNPDRLALCERGAALVVATLAALKAGKAYVSMDPAVPLARVRALLESGGVPADLRPLRGGADLLNVRAGACKRVLPASVVRQ